MTFPACRGSFRRTSHALLFALVCCAGCGGGEYMKRFGPLGDGPDTAPELYKPINIEGTTASVRIPQIFKTSFYENSPDSENGGNPVDPRRVQPPFLKLPALKICYEGLEANSGYRHYVYVAAPTLAEASAVAGGVTFADWIRQQLATAFPTASIAWQDLSCPTPAAGMMTYKYIRVVGDQIFYSGSGQYSTINGVANIMLMETPTYHFLIVWRTPSAIEATIGLDNLITKVGGCALVAK